MAVTGAPFMVASEINISERKMTYLLYYSSHLHYLMHVLLYQNYEITDSLIIIGCCYSTIEVKILAFKLHVSQIFMQPHSINSTRKI